MKATLLNVSIDVRVLFFNGSDISPQPSIGMNPRPHSNPCPCVGLLNLENISLEALLRGLVSQRNTPIKPGLVRRGCSVCPATSPSSPPAIALSLRRELHVQAWCVMYFRLEVVQHVSWRAQMPLRWTHAPLAPAFWPPQRWTVPRTTFWTWRGFGSTCSGQGMFFLFWHFDVDFVMIGVTNRDMEIGWGSSGKELRP